MWLWLDGYGFQLVQGVGITLAVALSALLLGFILAILGAVGELSNRFAIRSFVLASTSIIRSLPELLVLTVIYFGGSAFLSWLWGENLQVNSFIAGVLGLGIIFSAYGSQTLRGAFLAIPRGQQEAAQALGLKTRRIFSHILLPQAWRFALPGLGNLWLVLLKDTALVSLIGLVDLMSKAQIAANSTRQPFKFYFIAGLVFLLLTTLSQLTIELFTKRLKNRNRLH